MMMNPYEVLGIREGASMDEIRSAYRKKAKEYHPDLHPDDPQANEKMQRVNEAYEMLCNPDKYRAQQVPHADPFGDWTRTNQGGYASGYRQGNWQYTYYSNADGADFQREWQDMWERAYEEQRQRKTAVIRPFKYVFRFLAGIMLLRFLLTMLRIGLFGFFR